MSDTTGDAIRLAACKLKKSFAEIPNKTTDTEANKSVRQKSVITG